MHKRHYCCTHTHMASHATASQHQRFDILHTHTYTYTRHCKTQPLFNHSTIHLGVKGVEDGEHEAALLRVLHVLHPRADAAEVLFYLNIYINIYVSFVCVFFWGVAGGGGACRCMDDLTRTDKCTIKHPNTYLQTHLNIPQMLAVCPRVVKPVQGVVHPP